MIEANSSVGGELILCIDVAYRVFLILCGEEIRTARFIFVCKGVEASKEGRTDGEGRRECGRRGGGGGGGGERLTTMRMIRPKALLANSAPTAPTTPMMRTKIPTTISRTDTCVYSVSSSAMRKNSLLSA